MVFAQRRAAYQRQGLSYEQASRKALKDSINDLGFTMLAASAAGALSGGTQAVLDSNLTALRDAEAAIQANDYSITELFQTKRELNYVSKDYERFSPEGQKKWKALETKYADLLSKQKNTMAAMEQRKRIEEAIRKETREQGYEMPFNPQLYRLALEMATPYGWDGIDKTTFSIIAKENTESQKHRLRILESPGQTGEKAVPYSERGFEIDPRVRLYMDLLSTDGTYIMDKADSYSLEDLQILTAETGVEYTLLTIDGKSYLIRGNERGTTIPEDIAKSLYDKQGEFVCHSHPYIGDLKPSKSDLEFIKSLTWKTDSVIIDPTGDMIIYDQYGVREKKHNQPIRNENYYNDIFG